MPSAKEIHRLEVREQIGGICSVGDQIGTGFTLWRFHGGVNLGRADPQPLGVELEMMALIERFISPRFGGTTLPLLAAYGPVA
jgi:hypothetical protein